ncbi:MAG TPA: hypothetical protein VG101_09370 [Puia sp.]|nr:hypothetical protein [Puia sp.]
MKSFTRVLSVVLLFIFISCSSPKKKKLDRQMISAEDTTALTDNYIKLCYGIPTEADTSNFMEHAMQLLNASDYRGCLALFKSKYPKLDTVMWHSGFYGLIIPDVNITSYKPSARKYTPIDYLSFRYNNFLGDLVNDEQSWIFLESADIVHRAGRLYKLQEAESIGVLGYDSFRWPDSVIAKDAIKEIAPLAENDYKGSRRVEYILACAYLVLGDDVKAIPIYDKLIANNYYALPCLKNIIKYLGDKKRMDEQEKYIAIFEKMFPNECLLLERYYQSPTDSVKTICGNCIRMGTQRDSIKASMFLANYLLNKGAYRQFDSLTNIYFKQHTFESYDPLKKYEERFYSEAKIRELFLLKQYSTMFTYNDSRHLHIADNKNDFKQYVKQLYATYMPTNPLPFEDFFRKNFW